MRNLLVLVSAVLLVAGCAPAPQPAVPAVAPKPEVVEEAAPTPQPEVVEDAEPTPEVVEEEPEPIELSYTEEELKACFVAWEAEVEALANGVGDDATLKALAWECPSYDAWELGRLWYEYGGSPNLLKAICASETESPLCSEPKTLELGA